MSARRQVPHTLGAVLRTPDEHAARFSDPAPTRHEAVPYGGLVEHDARDHDGLIEPDDSVLRLCARIGATGEQP